MSDIPQIEMLTVEETHIRSGLAKCFIRRMVADGSVVSIRAGRKILINYDSVRAYLSTGVPQGRLCSKPPLPPKTRRALCLFLCGEVYIMTGYVKLNRNLLEWAWADNAVTFGVYAKFLLLAAWKDSEYHGVRLKRGELLTNQSEIAQQTGLSRQQVRTVLDRLKSTNRITIRQSGRNSIITILDYDCETVINQIDNHTSTTCQPDSNQTSLLYIKKGRMEEPKNARSREGGEFSESFNKFWLAYPKKTAKQQALKAFEKLKPDEELLNKMLSSLERQKKSVQWTKDSGQFIPYPATWINGRRWEDETTEVNSNGNNSANSQLEAKSESDWLRGFNGQ